MPQPQGMLWKNLAGRSRSVAIGKSHSAGSEEAGFVKERMEWVGSREGVLRPVGQLVGGFGAQAGGGREHRGSVPGQETKGETDSTC